MGQCKYNIKDSIHYLNDLIRKDEAGFYTVASEEDVSPETKDFPNLIEALEWIKQIGSIIHSTNGLTLKLENGSHLWPETNILKANAANDSFNEEVFASFLNFNINILGEGSGNTTIKFDAPLGTEYIRFIQSNVSFKSLRLKILGTNQNEKVVFHFLNGNMIVTNCRVDDITFSIDSKGSMFCMNTLFFNNNNTSKNILEAKYGGKIFTEYGNFNNIDFNITAIRGGEIQNINAINNDLLVYSPSLNTISVDRAIIIDGTTVVT